MVVGIGMPGCMCMYIYIYRERDSMQVEDTLVMSDFETKQPVCNGSDPATQCYTMLQTQATVTPASTHLPEKRLKQPETNGCSKICSNMSCLKINHLTSTWLATVELHPGLSRSRLGRRSGNPLASDGLRQLRPQLWARGDTAQLPDSPKCRSKSNFQKNLGITEENKINIYVLYKTIYISIY